MGNWLLQRDLPLFKRVLTMLEAGATLREVTAATQVHKNTAMRIRNVLLAEGPIYCPCGAPAGHRGFCRHRFAKSPRRQKVMAEMHARMRERQ